MREEMRANLEREVKGRLKARLKDQVMQALLDATTVDVPKALVEGEIERLRDADAPGFCSARHAGQRRHAACRAKCSRSRRGAA